MISCTLCSYSKQLLRKLFNDLEGDTTKRDFQGAHIITGTRQPKSLCQHLIQSRFTSKEPPRPIQPGLRTCKLVAVASSTVWVPLYGLYQTIFRYYMWRRSRAGDFKSQDWFNCTSLLLMEIGHNTLISWILELNSLFSHFYIFSYQWSRDLAVTSANCIAL